MQKLPPIPAAFLDKPKGNAIPAWTQRGQGIFEWSVFKIYEAALWIRGSNYDPDGHFILELRYLRAIAGEQLCDASMSEIRRLYPEHHAYFDAWKFDLNTVSPDIKRGDALVLEFRGNIGLRVFFNHTLLGEVNDAIFAKAFAGVWLDSRTKAPKLRQQLLALDSQ